MESILRDLIDGLKSTCHRLGEPEVKCSLQETLHDTESLPDLNLSHLASEALDLLSEVRLHLEPGDRVLSDHFFGYMNTKALCAAVDLKIPDSLQGGHKTLSALAKECGARPDRLRQIMRTLYNNGIFEYDINAGTYGNNHTSTLLISTHWTQWKNWIDLYGNRFYDMARGIPESCKSDTVRCPAQINFDTDDTMFKYFTDHGWIPEFHRTLSGGAVAQAPGILRDYPWGEVADHTILDIGGGGGGLIASLLREHKSMKGGVFDVSAVLQQAKSNFHDKDGQFADVGERVSQENLIEGDFFVSVPKSDVYTMKWCLHDWDDEKAAIIMRNLRASISEGAKSRLIVLELVLKDGHVGKVSRYGDLNMMVAVGGKERDESEWRKLAEETGWDLRRVFPIRNAWLCALEFVPSCEPNGDRGRDDRQSFEIRNAEPRFVTSQMRFLEPWNPARGIPYVRINPDQGYQQKNFEWKDYSVRIQDARALKTEFTLDNHGFAYYDDEIQQSVVNALRGDDKEIVEGLYYPHVESLMKEITGASRVIIFDHTLRKRRPDLGKTSNDDGKEQPATMVHCDQSEEGAIRRLKANIGDDENLDEILQRRVQMVNVWRPLNGPIKDWPLATMDYQSVKHTDMHPCDLLKARYEVRGQTATFEFSDNQKWYYLDSQRTNEVTVIKIWDNKADGVSKYCAHAAFQHPQAPAGLEPRESVEVRCLVIY